MADRDDLIVRFLDAIDRELASEAHRFDSVLELDTLFIGGGTPTHLPIRHLDRFLSRIRDRFALAADYEWSVEANPEDIDADKLSVLHDHGVNRVSLGVQSFDAQKLAVLERGHSPNAARHAIERVANGIENVSIDLIFAAPGENVATWESDLKVIETLPIKHVSTYALTFEKGTSFWSRRKRGGLSEVGEADEVAMYDRGREAFARLGLQHYEISNFAVEGFRCRHNLAYWRGEPWLAAGPGAASYLGRQRRVNHRSTTTYIKRIENGESPIAECDAISSAQAMRECAAFGIRMLDGIDLDEITARFGTDVDQCFASEINGLQSQGLLERHGSRLRLSEKGIHFADTVASEFLGFAD